MKKKTISTFFCFIFISTLLLIAPVHAEENNCGFAFLAPTIDGVFDLFKWNDSLVFSYEFGKIYLKNNTENLFVFIDFVKDTGNDNPSSQPRCDDFFEFAFDWDGNKKISPGLDRIYTLCKNEAKRLVYRYYLGKSTFSEVYFSQGQGSAGFGSSPNHSKPHRLFEFSLPLTETKKEDNKEFLFGIKLGSRNPLFYYEDPKNLEQDLSNLKRVSIKPPFPFINLVFTIGSRNMYANDSLYQMDTEPFIYNRRTFVPVRYIIEPLGGIFQWNEKDQRLVVIINDKIIDMKIDDPLASIDGKKVPIEKFNRSITPLLIPPGRVFVPLRFLIDTIGGKTTWDDKLQMITIHCGMY